MERLPDVTLHNKKAAEPEELTVTPPYGGRCEHCTAPVGVICDYPGEGPDCPIHAGQTCLSE